MNSIRKLKIKDFNRCAQLLAQEWDLGKKASQSTGNICGWIYLFDILGVGQKLFAYEKNNQLIGFVGYESYHAPFNLKLFLYKAISYFLRLSPQIKNKRALTAYYNAYDYCPNDMYQPQNCEMDILIIDKEYRGQKIGELLFDYICQIAKEDGFKNILISTDESCSYHFYERKNCIKIKEICVLSGEPCSEKGFVFLKKLKD